MGWAQMRPLSGKKLTIRQFSAPEFSDTTTRTIDIDVTSVPNYQSLTVDNFYILDCGFNPLNSTYNGVIRRTYNAQSGKVTVNESAGSSLSLKNPVTIVCVTME